MARFKAFISYKHVASTRFAEHLDLAFYRDLQERFKAPGDLAQATRALS